MDHGCQGEEGVRYFSRIFRDPESKCGSSQTEERRHSSSHYEAYGQNNRSLGGLQKRYLHLRAVLWHSKGMYRGRAVADHRAGSEDENTTTPQSALPRCLTCHGWTMSPLCTEELSDFTGASSLGGLTAPFLQCTCAAPCAPTRAACLTPSASRTDAHRARTLFYALAHGDFFHVASVKSSRPRACRVPAVGKGNWTAVSSLVRLWEPRPPPSWTLFPITCLDPLKAVKLIASSIHSVDNTMLSSQENSIECRVTHNFVCTVSGAEEKHTMAFASSV